MPERKGMNLNYEDRCEIEEMLREGRSFRAIAKRIKVSPSTVSYEIKTNRTIIDSRTTSRLKRTSCAKYHHCHIVDLCTVCTGSSTACKRCSKRACYNWCTEFELKTCDKLEVAPFVCGKCLRKSNCIYDKARYTARKAQQAHEERLRLAHTGVVCSSQDLAVMVDVVSKLLAQGQSLEAIWATHHNEFPVTVRTFYNYMEQGVMGLSNIQLPKKIKYTPRKKRAKGEPKMDMVGRTYADWLLLPEDLRVLTVQIDCVEGMRHNKKCILSLHFVRLFFQIYILLEEKTQECVKKAFDAIEVYCEGLFSDVCPIILGDRGSEFIDYKKIEMGTNGKRRAMMFYCDPMRPGQKGACEKNHVELRKILPKGSDFDALDQFDVAKICSHVNSYVRAGQGVAPIKLASLVLPKNLLESLGIREIEPDNVIMSPKLLEQ